MPERQSKREQFEPSQSKSSTRLLLPGGALLAVVVAVAVWFLLGAGGPVGVKDVSAAEDGAIRLAASDFTDGKARYFRFSGKQGPIKFFVVKSRDGVIRAAFDACDVCYKEKKGYHQEGDVMVCNNCGQAFRTELVNQVKGGCNPAPLQRQLVGDQILIHVAALEQGGRYF